MLSNFFAKVSILKQSFNGFSKNTGFRIKLTTDLRRLVNISSMHGKVFNLFRQYFQTLLNQFSGVKKSVFFTGRGIG